jgi:hypothetical protein
VRDQELPAIDKLEIKLSDVVGGDLHDFLCAASLIWIVAPKFDRTFGDD